MKQCIYELAGHYIENTIPSDIKNDRIGLFTSKQNAIRFIKNNHKYIKSEEEGFHLLYLSLEKSLANKKRGEVQISVYLPKGKYYGDDEKTIDAVKPFHGRALKDQRFKVGDIVMFNCPFNRLQIGIISLLPFTPEKVKEITKNNFGVGVLDSSDDVYCILYYENNLLNHDHAPECYIFKPHVKIDKKLIKRLKTALKKLVRARRANTAYKSDNADL
ncbi:MAG: hypothetical protein AABZ39_00235 [Spirochaetota bacterium]